MNIGALSNKELKPLIELLPWSDGADKIEGCPLRGLTPALGSNCVKC
jgi:hypothetical protein